MRYAPRLLILIVCLYVCMMLTAQPAALADELAGHTFKTFIYSDLADESSTTLSFEANGSLLIDAFDGVGLYFNVGNIFIASFSAPNYNEKKDLVLFLNGVTVLDYLTGIGIAFVDNDFYETFFLFGYAV